MKIYEVFHVIMQYTTVSFLTMDDVLDFVQDMPTSEFITCKSVVSHEEWLKFRRFADGG